MPEHKDVKHTTRLSNLEWQLFTHSAVEERCMNEILWFSWSNNNVPLFIAVQGLKVLCLSKWKNCHYKEIHDGPMPTPTTLGYFIQQLFLLKEKAKSFFFYFRKTMCCTCCGLCKVFYKNYSPSLQVTTLILYRERERALQIIRPHALNWLHRIPIHNIHPKQSAREGLVCLKPMPKDSGMMNCFQWIFKSALQANIVHNPLEFAEFFFQLF